MKLKIDVLEESIKQIVREELEYQEFFKKALEKTGKSIPQMSDEEKKSFFNKIDAAWKAKGEKNESVNESLKQFDYVDIKSKNLTGIVYKIQGNTVVVRTICGLVKAKKNDVTKIQSDPSSTYYIKAGFDVTKNQSDNINEDFGTIALGVAGGLLLLKVLKFVAKKIIGGVALNAPLGKEPLYTTIDSMTKELIKLKTKDPNGKLKEVSLMDIVKLEVVLKKLVDKGQIKTMKDIQNIIAKASKR